MTANGLLALYVGTLVECLHGPLTQDWSHRDRLNDRQVLRNIGDASNIMELSVEFERPNNDGCSPQVAPLHLILRQNAYLFVTLA